MRRPAVLPPLALGAVLLGACGGGQPARSTSTTAAVANQPRATQSSVSVPPRGAALATACRASLSVPQPRVGGTDTLVLSSAPANAPVSVVIVSPDRTRRHLSGTTDGTGGATLVFPVRRPGGTTPVDVIVMVGTATCATSYTVVP